MTGRNRHFASRCASINDEKVLSFLLSLHGAELAVQSCIVSGHGRDASHGNEEEHSYYDGLPIVTWKVLQ